MSGEQIQLSGSNQLKISVAPITKTDQNLSDLELQQKILDVRADNISYFYDHIQSIFGWMALVGIVLFAGSYIYIITQAKRALKEITNEKAELKKEYDSLLEFTSRDIKQIKDDNEFTGILVHGNKLNALGLFDDAIDFYNDQLDKRFIAEDEGRKYSIYKELTNVYYTRGQKSEKIFENIDKYENALRWLEKAMTIYNDREEDITYRSNIEINIDELSRLIPSEQ